MAPSSVQRMRHSLTRWAKFSPVPYSSVTPQALTDFRRAGLAAGLSPHSIEQTVTDVCLLTGHPPGRRLRRPPPSPDVPTVERVAAIYRAVGAAQWPQARRPQGGTPCRWLKCSTAQWWRTWIVCACWFGFRLADLRRLSTADMTAGQLRAKKTGKGHPLVIPPFVARHWRLMKSDTMGPLSPKQLRRELRRIAKSAGVRYVEPHGFRRFAVTQWSAVSVDAGKIVHGESLGVRAHYIEPRRILEDAAPRVRMPACFLTPKEISDAMKAEEELLTYYRRATPAMRKAILTVVRAG